MLSILDFGELCLAHFFRGGISAGPVIFSRVPWRAPAPPPVGSPTSTFPSIPARFMMISLSDMSFPMNGADIVIIIGIASSCDTPSEFTVMRVRHSSCRWGDASDS